MSALAVIDIGTLKVKTEIATINDDGTLNSLYKSNELTCFGVGIDENNGYAQERYILETINELKRIKVELSNHTVQHYKVISTHAMRRAKNRDEIIARIKKEVGFDVDNISQEQEAELFFRAVMKTFKNKSQEYVVIDVGGGSVQVLVGTPEKLNRAHMMQTGAQYLHERYSQNPHEPHGFNTSEDIERMKQHILDELLPFTATPNIPLIYGSSIIIDVMKKLNLQLDPHPDSSTHPYKTYAKTLQQVITSVLPYSFYEREQRYQDMFKGWIWAVDKGFTNAITVAEHFQSPYIVPSNANIAQGLLYQINEQR